MSRPGFGGRLLPALESLSGVLRISANDLQTGDRVSLSPPSPFLLELTVVRGQLGVGRGDVEAPLLLRTKGSS